ncbi:AMP_1a_G0036750.mRNA.1.CDS.1 [Saccharomyces cerevisiae]|nr:AMP_1a_G0036750.mRNA.1.CDS.1 [Saccharomyces cerevisiae]CAI4647299.1 ACA_G0036970.mRNA.1.CDS.1 [Saccharomyces cerevisiae]CAI4647702.1 ACA_G0037020.mRNA.1.CDS.1 [Saccharomyces cerevisiae]CAI6805119.1 AMP_1a_G0036750.mRNA.1.CDS.1 [Saccharomyces cerevisiae]CAI6809558.1 ACA_G0036970.mRNA.1.CDS.1 [Saccharomyces cerevisiae]
MKFQYALAKEQLGSNSRSGVKKLISKHHWLPEYYFSDLSFSVVQQWDSRAIEKLQSYLVCGPQTKRFIL